MIASARPGSGLMPVLKASVDEVGEERARNLVQSQNRSGLVERAPRSDHLFHQARFGSREYIPDLALMLRGGAQRMLDAAAVEAVDRLKLVECDDHRALALGGELARKREDVIGEAIDIARRRRMRERHRESAEARFFRLVANLRPAGSDSLHQ